MAFAVFGRFFLIENVKWKMKIMVSGVPPQSFREDSFVNERMREYRRPCADMQSLYKSVGRMDIMRMPQKRTKKSPFFLQ